MKNRVSRIHAGSKGSDHVRLLKYNVRDRKGMGAIDPAVHETKGTPVRSTTNSRVSQDNTHGLNLVLDEAL